MKIDFEYCECGCHGHMIEFPGGESYWVYNSLKNAKALSVYQGHGNYGPFIGRFDTFDQVRLEMKKRAIVMVAKMKEQIKALEGFIGEESFDPGI